METYKRRRGDRRDARWLREIDSMHAILPHLMPKRTDSEAYLNAKMDVTDALAYIAQKNEGEEEYRATLFHCFIMAIAKTIRCRPSTAMFPAGGTISATRSPWALWSSGALRITARRP